VELCGADIRGLDMDHGTWDFCTAIIAVSDLFTYRTVIFLFFLGLPVQRWLAG